MIESMSSKYFFIESLQELYTDVQTKEIFPDSKFFVDCTPIGSVESILKKYDQEKHKESFSLKLFIAANFTFPEEPDNQYKSEDKPILHHLNQLWNVLKRMPDHRKGTLIPLPYPYIVPGGRFREIYYWDSYFTMLGLEVSGRTDMIENMVDNFDFLIRELGFIPNGNRTYYLGRSQPPFFALMVELLSTVKGPSVLMKYAASLQKEYAFWMEGSAQLTATNNTHRRVVLLPDGAVLNRYWDDQDTPRPEAYIEDVHVAKRADRPAAEIYRNIRAAAESGWDFSSRWFKIPDQMHTIQTTELIPVDLNCLLLHLEEVLLQLAILTKDEAQKIGLEQQIIRRKNAIQTYCWNEQAGFYFDYQFTLQAQTPNLTLAGLFPLFFELADANQAGKVANMVEQHFLRSGGVITTINKTGQQWDAPNGWAPLQWITYKGLKNYGLLELANKIKHNWLQTNDHTYADTGKMMEKYNVTDSETSAGGGEYPNQDGFGWTNAVYLKMNRE